MLQQDVKGNINMKVNRDLLVTMQDIRNIALKIKRERAGVPQDDAQDLRTLVADLQTKPHNPVLFYKEQGTGDFYSQSPVATRIKDALHTKSSSPRFLLVMQTQFQRLLYQKWGAGSVVTFDATHHTTGMQCMAFVHHYYCYCVCSIVLLDSIMFIIVVEYDY